VAGQPTGTTATEGPTGTEPGGVVPTGATAEGPAVGEKPQFRPLTDEEKTKTEAPATETKTDIETAADQAREAIKETKKGQRGRPKLVLTPEQEASKAAEGRATKAAYQRADRAIKKQTKILESAINTGNQTNRRAAYKELLKLESAIRGTAAGIAAKATLEKHRNRFTTAELDSLKREVKAETPQALPSIGSATYKSDPKLGKVTNGAQAIAQIVKTGNPFQQMLAKRIRGFVNGVKIVVVEDGAPLPARLQSGRAAEQWANARGLYVPSEKTVYIRGDSFGNSQGTNNVTILHELLHAATYQKLKLGQLALERGWSSDNAVTLATQDLQRTMDSAKKRFDELSAAGKLPKYIQDLSTQAKVFSNLDEFLAYGMSDDAMQTFLLGAKGYEGNANFFSRFVNSIRNYFGMDVDSINALSDLVLVTDKLLSARKSPTMRLLEAADKATAKREELALPSWFGGDKTAKSDKSVAARPSANVARLAKMLGSKLYGTPDDIARVSLKELFQNSFDAIKEGLEKKNEPWHITKGKIDIKVDSKTRTISITDNGPGMPTSVMGNQFLQIAGTVKGTSRASGGLGVAKMLFLFENKQLEVVSLRDGVVSRLSTTGEELKLAMASNPRTLFETLKDFVTEDDMVAMEPIIQMAIQRQKESGVTIPEINVATSTDPKTIEQYTKTLFPDGHGTFISIQVPESYKDESTGEDKTIRFDTYDLKFSKVLTNSPLFNDIDVTFSSGGSPSMLDIGNGFPVADYTPFANVRFAWGTARIYVSKKVEDSYGDNTHILSNGLWQFSKTLKDKPGWDGKSIKRRFYIDVTPDESVKPEDAGYPFDLNRQNFSKAADGDFSKIFNYVTALYRQVDFASEVQNFGTVQYINAGGSLTKAELLEPKAPTTDNAFTLIKPGDAVEVRDGVLYVNNRKIPELTNDDLKNTAIRIDELTIPQDQIDPSKVMVHDNMTLPVKEQGSAKSRLYDLEDSNGSKFSVDYEGPNKYSFTVNNDDGTRTKFVGSSEDIASDLEDVGILTPQATSGTTLSGNARAKFGKRYDTYLQTIGSVFQQLRNALIAADPEYNTPPRGGASLSKIGIGVSLDSEYYGVSTILPFEAMFINPATTALKGSASQIAVSMIGTMQHELAHYRVRSHNADFASEMQRVMNLLDTYDGIDMSAVKKKLSAFIQNNNDIFTYLDGEFKSGNYKPVGNRLKDSGSFQARNESAVESMEGAGSAGGRGPSLSRITQSGTQSAGQVGVSEGDVDEDAEGTAERSQRQLDKDVDLALNKVAESKDNETLAKAVGLLQLARNPKNIIPQLQLLWNAATYYERNALVRLPTMDFLVSWAGKKVPELRNTYDLMQKMGGMTQQILKQSGVLTTDVHRAFLEDSGLRPKLENLVFTATIAQVDPSDTSAKLRNAKLDTMYADLGSKGQQLYNRIKNHFENLSDLYSKLLDDQIKNSRLTAEEKSNLMAELRKMYETGKKITPYFPLTRHGDYWLSIGSGKNRQFYMYESLMGRDNAMQAMADKSIYRKPNESAAAFERRKQDNLKELIEDGTYDVGNDIHSLRRKSFDSSLLLRGVFDSIDSSNLGDPNAKESLKDAIYQIYLQTMPEQSFRNQFINRKNTTGFSTDLVRSVSTASVKMATQLARIKYAPYIRNSLSAARDSVSGQPKNEPFVSEMDRRADTTLGFHNETTGDKFARVFNKASFFFYLGGASTALLQPMSVFQTGMPVLAARYGAVNATREMSKMLRVWNEYGVWRTNANGTKSWVAPSIEDSKGLTPDERKAVRGMAAYGVSESTFSRALYEQKGSPTEKLSGPKVQLGKDAVSALLLGGLMHSSERISREMVFLTSFRLNMKQHGDFDRSVREAVNDTNEALFNYGGYNRPRYMQTGVGKVLTQFQMYPLQVTLFLLNNFKQMIVPMDDSTRKEATIKFFGTMFTTGVLAGAIGLPIAAVAGLLGAFWRKLDEEELLPEDLKNMDPMFWFRTIFLPSQLGHITIGGKTLSSIVERGPINALTGLDISGRTGMSNLWSHDSKEYKTVREELIAAALDRAGPSVSMVLSLADAYDAFSKGDMQKGVEKMLPAGFRNFVVAHKYATEGAKDVTGAPIMSKDSFRRGELIGRAIGFQPDLLANAQYVNFRANGLALRIENERTELLNSLNRDLVKSDFKKFSGVLKEIQKFNSKHPSYEITEDNITGSLEKRAEQRASSLKGVVLTDKNVPVFIKSLAASRKELAEREKEARP
jgi:signal peptidase I